MPSSRHLWCLESWKTKIFQNLLSHCLSYLNHKSAGKWACLWCPFLLRSMLFWFLNRKDHTWWINETSLGWVKSIENIFDFLEFSQVQTWPYVSLQGRFLNEVIILFQRFVHNKIIMKKSIFFTQYKLINKKISIL